MEPGLSSSSMSQGQLYTHSSNMPTQATDSAAIGIEDNGDIDLALLCRICASPTDYLIPIFEGEGLENNLSDKIHSHLPIKVNARDALPDQVCYQCASTLLAWHDLVQCCVQADIALHARVLQGHTKGPAKKRSQTSSAKDQTQGRSTHCRPSFPALRPPAGTHGDLQLLASAAPERLSHVTVCPAQYVDSKNALKRNYEFSGSIFPSLLHKDLGISSDFDKKRTGKTKENVVAINKWSIINNVPKVLLKDLHTAILNFKIHYEIFHKADSPAVDYSDSAMSFAEENREPPSNNVETVSDDSGAVESYYTKEITEKLQKAKVKIDDRVFYRCSICGKNLVSPSKFTEHMRVHSGEKPYVCHVCGKRISTSWYLQRHLKETHLQIKSYACSTCGRGFAARQNLVEHERTHSEDRPYVCPECGKSFKTRGSLWIHNMIHTGRFPFKCSICDAKFRRGPQLTHHMYKHTGERPNVCEVCGRGFRVKHRLSVHRRSHSGERPFGCGACGAAFRQKRSLTAHCSKAHTPH